MVVPAAVRLRLPWSLHVHPTFHVSQVKPVKESHGAFRPNMIDANRAATRH